MIENEFSKNTLWVKNSEDGKKNQIGYERLKKGLSVVAAQFKVQDNFKGKRIAVNDVLKWLSIGYNDTKDESVPEITLHYV